MIKHSKKWIVGKTIGSDPAWDPGWVALIGGKMTSTALSRHQPRKLDTPAGQIDKKSGFGNVHVTDR